MRRRIVMVCLAALLPLLSACSNLPQSREMGSTAVVSVLGVEAKGKSMTVYAGAESRAGAPPTFYQGDGQTLAQAIETLSITGDALLSCAHVEHILLAQSGADRLDDLLSYAFRDPRQSTESQLWLVQTEDLSQVFGENQDPAQRMTVLQAAGKDKQIVTPVTLRETASTLAAGAPILLPALQADDDGLTFAGYTIYREGRFAETLTGPAALGAALLRGEAIHWTESIGDRAVTLESTSCRVEPQWEGERLTAFTIRCALDADLTGGWNVKPTDQPALERRTARAITTALEIMQETRADAAHLKHRAGLTDPLRWPTLSQQWDSLFSALPFSVTVEITMEDPP